MNQHEYVRDFLPELTELIQTIGDCLLLLEKDPQDASAIDNLFRPTHSIKGASLTIYSYLKESSPDDISLAPLKSIGDLTHTLEDFLSKVRDEHFPLDASYVDVMFQVLERIESFTQDLEQGREVSHPIDDLQSILLGWLKSDSSFISPSETPKQEIHETQEEQEETQAKHEQRTDEPTSEEIDTSSMNECNFELIIDVPPTHRPLAGAYLTMVYRDIQAQYPHSFFSPSVEDLVSSNHFEVERIFGTVFTHHVKDSILTNIQNIRYVKEVILMSFSTPQDRQALKQKEEEQQLADQKNKLAKKEKSVSEIVPKKRESNETIRVPLKRVNELLKNMSELVITKNKLKNLAPQVEGEIGKAIQTLADEMDKTVTDLQNGTMSIRMTPLEQLFSRFPVSVRRDAKSLGKQIEFISEGGNTEIDKALLDHLFEPLNHIVRNSISHGIESEEERLKKGKPKEGRICIRARHEQGFVVIEIEDDGKGLDLEKVTKKAIERGDLSEEKAKNMSSEELAELIFNPGLSTAEKVTDVSGRGVGMDSVRDIIKNKMRGQIEILTETNVGTTIRIKLPLTLSIIMAILTYVNGEVYAFPSSHIFGFRHLPVEQIRYIGNREFYLMDQKEIPIVRLHEYFNIPYAKNEKILKLVIITVGAKQLAVVVDAFGTKMNIVVRSINNHFASLNGLSGCFVLPNGDIGLIVDPNSLINTHNENKKAVT